MKKYFILFITTFLFTDVCTAYTEDIILQKCMKDRHYPTSAMIQCTYERGDYYKDLSAKLAVNLMDKLPPANYNKLLANQVLLNRYIYSLDAGATDILSSVQGTIYYTMASGIKYHVYRENYWILSMLDTKNICKNPLENKYSISEIESSIKSELKKLEPDLKKLQYESLIESQRAWKVYFDDTKDNILPMFNDKPEIKKYIIRMLYENRLAVLQTIRTPYEKTELPH